MNEAKKRNPDIKLYGLSWAFPQWVTCAPGTLSNCSAANDPYGYPDQLATYITKWVTGAQNTYGLEIDYIGSWNERAYNTTYLKTLRKHLDTAGATNTKIVAPDSGWSIAGDILADPDLAAAVWGIGAHYPGMSSSSQAEQTGKPLWASEDDSTYNNDVGAECWARIINRNFVNGNMTATINWNLIAAYMKGTNWYRAGLMNALNPWSGAYGANTRDGSFTAGPMIWASAHTTQFTKAGWTYMLQGSGNGGGSGVLSQGGTYVTLVDYTPGSQGDFTIVIEKMSRNHSSCVRPGLPNYVTEPETATFQLQGDFAKVTQLQLWYTHWAYWDGDQTVEFQKMAPVQVVNGKFTLTITVDSMYTLSTVTTATKGSYGTPPSPTLFPPAHTDDFEACPVSSEAAYFADQNGIFECMPSNEPGHGIVMRQMVPLRPVTWGGDIRPHSLIGHRDGVQSSMVVDAYIEEPGASVLLGLHMQGTDNSQGVIFSLDTGANTWYVHNSIQAVDNANSAVLSGPTNGAVQAGQWHTYRYDINGSATNGFVINLWIDGMQMITNFNTTAKGMATSGHAAIGTREYGHFTQFDNFQLYTAYQQCGLTPLQAGAPVSVVDCTAEVGAQPGSLWNWSAQQGQWNGMFSLKANASLCMTANPNAGASWMLTVEKCDPSSPYQNWAWNFDGIAPDNERKSQLYLPQFNRCVDIVGQLGDVGAQLDAYQCNGGTNQAFFWDFDQSEIGNEAYSVCVGVC